MKIFSIILFFLFVQILFAQNKAISYDRLETLRLGKEEMQMSNYENAISHFTKITQKEPKNHDILDRIGRCYYHLKNYEKAKEYFKLAILYSTKNANYYANIAAVYSELDDNETAYYYAKKALEIKETPLTLFNAASIANELEKPDESLKLLNNSKLDKSKANDLNKVYADAYFLKRNMEKSILHYDRFFFNFQSGNSDKTYDFYSMKRYYYEKLVNNYARNVKENNGNKNYLQDIEGLYIELMQTDEKDKTIDRSLPVLSNIVATDTMQRAFIKKMLFKTPYLNERLGEFYVNLYEFDNVVKFYEEKKQELGTEEFMNEKDNVNLTMAYLYEYSENLDKKWESKIMTLYKENSNELNYLNPVTEHIFEILKAKPETYDFFFSLAEKIQNPDYRDNIKYELTNEYKLIKKQPSKK
mgnify:CR=1 FL=1